MNRTIIYLVFSLLFFSQPVYSQTQREDEIEALRVSQQQRDSLLRVLFQQRHAIQDSVAAYSKALVYYEKALTIREKVFGPEHPNTISVKNNILAVDLKIFKDSGAERQ